MSNFWDRYEARKGTPAENGHQPAPSMPAGRPRDHAYGLAALDAECANVARAVDGTRNHTLNIAAVKLGGLVAAGVLDERAVRDALYAAGKAAGLAHAEMVGANGTGGTIGSGLRKGTTEPRTIPDRPARAPLPDAYVLDEDSDPDEVGDWIREHLPAIDWKQLWDDDQTEEWILEPLLPARRLVALYSAPKVGKSLLMLELAVAVSRGTPALGVTPDRPRRVLYVDFENDPKGDVRERLQGMGLEPHQLDGLDYLSYPGLPALDSPRGGQILAAACRVYGSEVVVVDTVSRAVGGEENDNDTWLNFYRHTGLAMKRAGIALIRLDHSGKDETKGQRGGSAKSGDVDAVWRMSHVVDDVYRLECEAARMPIGEKTLVLHREVGPLRHRVDATGRAAAWEAKAVAVVAAMDAAGLDREAGSTKAREVARTAGVKARNDVVAEAVRRRRSRFP